LSELNCSSLDLCLLLVTSSGISGRCGISGGCAVCWCGGLCVVSVSVVQGKWSTSPWVQWGQQSFMVSVIGKISSIAIMVRSIIAAVEVMGTEKAMVSISVGVSIAEVVCSIGIMSEVMSVASVMMEEGSIVTVAMVAIEGQLGVVGITGHH